MTGQPDRFGDLAASDPAEAARIAAEIAKHAFVPHEAQREILASQARFVTVRAGRRFGKSKLAAHKLLRAAIGKKGSMNWCIANRYKNTRRIYREVVKQCPRSFLAKPAPSDQSNELILQFKNGSRIEFYSGGSPDSLAGEGVDFVVIDEAALIEERVWFQLIRPTLMDTQGSAFIISTPRGRNWFWKLCRMGLDPDLPDYETFHFSQRSNPYVPESETEEARRTLPAIVYAQEIEAEFIDSAASIFRIPERSIIDELWAPRGQVFLGIDLAKKEDYTVIDGIRGHDLRPCYHDKFNDLSWPDQRRMILAAIKSIEDEPNVDGVTVGVDSTGLGDVIFDDLDEAGVDVVPINFGSGDLKKRMVMLLAADLAQGKAYILEQQREEFDSYEYEITPAGRYKFEASSGHDDEVSAKLIQHWVAKHEAEQRMSLYDVTPADLEVEQKAESRPEPVIADSVSEMMARDDIWR